MSATHRTSRGFVVILSGPSGVGKSTLIRRMLDREGFSLSVSATTRAPRPGEVHGRDYFFLGDEEFDRLVAEDAFLEWAVVHGRHRYGTLRREVERLLDAGRIVILDVDVQGARALVGFDDAVSVFVAPPSFDHLERRLRGRSTESDETLRARLETARAEMALTDAYDHVVVNDDLDAATEALCALLLAAREKRRAT